MKRSSRIAGLIVCITLAVACGSNGLSGTDTTRPVEAPLLTTISITASGASVSIGGTLQLNVSARDQSGRLLSPSLRWVSRSPSLASVSTAGLVTGLSAGSAVIQASGTGADSLVSGSYAVAVVGTSSYVPGQSYFGRNNYIEYIAGNAPVILSAPHGGALTPSSIPDRTAAACGGAATTVTDANTAELVRAMQQRFFARFGRYPHVIISNLSRRKLDPNRVQPEAACGNADAAAALSEWHAYIDSAKAAILKSTSAGWYMDMHGHGHTIQRLELGYLLADADLNLSNSGLDASSRFRDVASIRTVAQTSPLTFSALLRGPTSLGTLYANNGFPSLPSSTDPSPNGADYFNGGDNTARHTCGSLASALGGTTNGNICGVQIEANFTGVRDNAANRDRFADVTAVVLEEYLRTHLGLRLATP